MSAPAISVIMPTYNGAAFVTETIDSLLAQSCGDFELVIADDCSTDDTRDVLARHDDPRIRVLPMASNQGPVHARNHAFAHARGRYIMGLDQDDLCRPDRLATQLAYLDANPGVVLVASRCALLEDGETRPWPGVEPLDAPAIDWLLMLQNPIVWSSVMFRAEAARALDPFERPHLRYAEDFDLYHRIRAHGEIGWLDEPLTIYRCHPGGASKKYRDAMAHSAAAALTERYAPIFGEAAQANAALVVEHLMAREPVPDLGTLSRLLAIVDALHRHFLRARIGDAQARASAEREYSRIWWMLTRAALRQGSVSAGEVRTLRPEGLPVAVNEADWIVSSLIGRVRALRSAAR